MLNIKSLPCYKAKIWELMAKFKRHECISENEALQYFNRWSEMKSFRKERLKIYRKSLDKCSYTLWYFLDENLRNPPVAHSKLIFWNWHFGQKCTEAMLDESLLSLFQKRDLNTNLTTYFRIQLMEPIVDITAVHWNTGEYWTQLKECHRVRLRGTPDKNPALVRCE